MRLENVRIVLTNPSHPGNIGAVARCMKNMQLDTLYLIKPKLFPHADATARAAGADELLAKAVVTQRFDEAISECGLVIGTSARERMLDLPLLDPRQCAHKVMSTAPSTKIALVFGREHAGLTNEELLKCHYHVHIPSNPDFSSLNLASAVLVLTYELRMASLANALPATIDQTDYADTADVEWLYQQLEQLLLDIEFLQADRAAKLMNRLRRLFNRAHLEKTELNILCGIIATIHRKRRSE